MTKIPSRPFCARSDAFEAPGYTPYFEQRGQDAFAARLQAAAVRQVGRRFHAEHQDRRIALKALHTLAKRPRWHPALARHVVILCDRRPDVNAGVIPC